MKLYEITTEHQEILSLLEDNNGELTPEIEQALDLSKEQFEIKAASCGYVYKTLEDNSLLLGNEIARLQKLKKQVDNNSSWLKERVSTAMKVLGIDKVTHNNITLSFRKSTVVKIEEEHKVPNEFVTYKPTIDKTALKKDLQEGRIIDGCGLVEKQNLQIK